MPTDPDSRRRQWQIARVLLLITATALVAWIGYVAVENNTYADLTLKSDTRDSRQGVVEMYVDQSKTFTDWSFAVLAGIIAIAVTAKVHDIRFVRTAYIILGPAGAFLLTSLRAGWQFQRRRANVVAFDDYSDLGSLASLLQDQTRLFLWGLACATMFGAWCLLNIVGGVTDPREHA